MCGAIGICPSCSFSWKCSCRENWLTACALSLWLHFARTALTWAALSPCLGRTGLVIMWQSRQMTLTSNFCFSISLAKISLWIWWPSRAFFKIFSCFSLFIIAVSRIPLLTLLYLHTSSISTHLLQAAFSICFLYFPFFLGLWFQEDLN